MQLGTFSPSRRAYKLRLRCLSCMKETYRGVTVDETRASTTQLVDAAIRAQARRQSYQCPSCAGMRSSIVAYFEAGSEAPTVGS